MVLLRFGSVLLVLLTTLITLSKAAEKLKTSVSVPRVKLEGTKLANGTVTFVSQCHKDIFYFWTSRHEQWAKQMLDSYGKIGNSILLGNKFYFGSYDECMDVRVPASAFAPEPFNTTYYWLIWGYRGEWTKKDDFFSTGTCIPASCKDKDLLMLFPSVRYAIVKEYPSLTTWFKEVQLLNVQQVPPTPPIPTSGIWCLTVIGIFIALVVFGTVVDYAQSQEEPSTDDKNKKPPEELPRYNFQTGVFKVPWRPKSPSGRLSQILCCFSLFKSLSTIFNISSNAGQLTCLNGIRFLSMLWVIMEHCFINLITIASDLNKGLDKMDTSWAQIITAGEFCVDTFFLLSGFLLTYVFLKSPATENMTFSKWIYFYVHRLLRISPTFYMILFFSATVYPYLSDGPYWSYALKITSDCTTQWWTHLFYISNVVDTTEKCMPWTWYLPNDMQFYWLSPIFLIMFKRSPRIIVPLIWIGIVGGVVITYILAYMNDFSMTIVYLRLMKTDPVIAQKSIEDVSNVLYTKPYCRIGPYLIGMLLGYHIYQCAGRRVITRKGRTLYFWFLTCVAIYFCIWALHKWDAGRIIYSFYHAASRQIWSGAVAWIIFVCATGQGGLLNDFLSWKAFQPLSRLSYCVYLVHPFFIYGMYYSIREPFQSNLYVCFTLYFGFILWALLAALLFSVVVEVPFAKLEKLLLQPADKNTS